MLGFKKIPIGNQEDSDILFVLSLGQSDLLNKKESAHLSVYPATDGSDESSPVRPHFLI
jgi:hypothetical protein